MEIGGALLLDIASWALIVLGSFLLLVAAIGLLRMPDVYTRMHAAGIAESGGATMLLLGLILQAGLTINAFKLFVLIVLFFFTSPVATHALARAALYAGLRPICAKDAEEASDMIASGAITMEALHDDRKPSGGSSSNS